MEWWGNSYWFSSFDADAAAYFTRVETADGQALENAVKNAINAFVVGCKADGIWNAIKASCILAGARTLAGALAPLAGPTPTRVGNAGGWSYNRKTGLQGNATDNYLNSGLPGNALSPNSNHLFVNGSAFENTGTAFKGSIGVFESTNVRLNLDLIGSSPARRAYRGPSNSFASITSGITASGSVSGSRNSSSLSKLFQDGTEVASNTTATSVAALPSANFFVYGLNLNGTAVDLTGARFNFYSIGDGLSDANMAQYHARVAALINALAAAIP